MTLEEITKSQNFEFYTRTCSSIAPNQILIQFFAQILLKHFTHCPVTEGRTLPSEDRLLCYQNHIQTTSKQQVLRSDSTLLMYYSTRRALIVLINRSSVFGFLPAHLRTIVVVYRLGVSMSYLAPTQCPRSFPTNIHRAFRRRVVLCKPLCSGRRSRHSVERDWTVDEMMPRRFL